jgi:ArsR family transcriptional regulator
MLALQPAASLLQLLAEPTRVRLLALLAEQELTVAEIVQVTELGQSTVSTHLGKLREASLVRDRRAGASTYYALADGGMPEPAAKVWSLVRSELDDPLLAADRARAEATVRARASFPDAHAGHMERHYSPGRTWESMARAFVGLMRLGDVLDVGSGDGTVAELVAPRARSITCVDESPRMVEAAGARLARFSHARALVGDAQKLALPDRAFDQVLLFHVLAHVATPGRAVSEAARVLRPGGALVLVTLDAHDHPEITSSYGQLHAGFSPAQVRRMLVRSGLTIEVAELACREKRPPYFQVVTAFAIQPS